MELPYLFRFQDTTKTYERVWKVSLEKISCPDISTLINMEGINMVLIMIYILLLDTSSSFSLARKFLILLTDNEN